TTGVHSTLEPAAASLPVLFGPRIGNAEEALTMVDKGAGFVLRRPQEALSRLLSLLTNEDVRRQAGDAARATVEAQSGAADRSVELLRRYL
ncbi:3-deoxy-D-manno-octulosonic acid transferase, partial [bacterium]|nr:3-deoxy-D-manno-octulosonic acid transferase [bacterium]